jgi:transcription elongation factor Elf1
VSLFEDFLMYELCFPGAISGETEVDCPYCGTQLTVAVEDPMGRTSFQCCECAGVFEVDFGEGVVRYEA